MSSDGRALAFHMMGARWPILQCQTQRVCTRHATTVDSQDATLRVTRLKSKLRFGTCAMGATS